MNDATLLLLDCAAGAALGGVFFGGLWWTVCQGVSSQYPAAWFFLSFLLRVSIALGGFYFVSGSHWQRLVLCLIGFVAARLLVTLLTRAQPEAEASHAP